MTLLDQQKSVSAHTMRALMLVGDRKIELRDIEAPPPPAAGEVQIAIKAIGLTITSTFGVGAAWHSPNENCR